MPLFDAYIFVDWSASNRRHGVVPRQDAIWSDEYPPLPSGPHYHRTRHDATEYLLERALHHIEQSNRLLIGFDFPYGYPFGLTQALGHQNGPMAWSHLWDELAERIQDTPKNVNNRFIVASDLNSAVGHGARGPFYGCHRTRISPSFGTHSPGFPFGANNAINLNRLRIAENRLPGTQETWKLYGNGSVGSQSLVGIPYLRKLRYHCDLQNYSKVWPFETGFTAMPSSQSGPIILHAEIWPSVVRRETYVLLTANPGWIRDQAQVRAMCEWAAGLDQQGQLGNYFSTPSGLTPQELQVCQWHEGWVLGAT